ncbi:flagellar hook-length control protein [Erwinia typographi]|uniref:Flagellar hook-length control protein n=1 Tax=Erwinia typographi TaxID=371042 RepID=A0A0A3ZEI7_9GAMM|nr:flagellar hook-length control protein FliK [Erwinia typographi]KGT96021.1 flagellar hook-length control protein [Erwinia typographi]
MITLPLATNGTTQSSSGHSATASATTDVANDTTAAEESAASAKTSEGFITLLGNKLLSLTQQSDTGQATAASTDTADAAQSPKAKLNALLAALDKPETLNDLLQPATGGKALKTDEASDDQTQSVAPSLNESDAQALQALFAMLPPAVAQQPAAAEAKGADTLTAERETKGAIQSTLSSLAAADGSTSDGKEKASVRTDNVAAASATQKAPAETALLNNAFQQAINATGKEADKENSSSAPAATITNNVLSAASALSTPATAYTVTPPAGGQLSAQLGSQDWQQALGQQILMFSKNGQQTAELHLHPQDLGSIQISLKLDNDQAQLNMVSGHSQVRAALEAALPQLRTALAENGISLGQSNVSSDAFQQGQSFSGQQEQQRNNQSGNAFSLAAENDSDVTPIAVPAALQARAAGSSAVDIFA